MYDELSDQLAILGTKMVCMFFKIIWGRSMNTCRQLSNRDSENWIFYCRVWPHIYDVVEETDYNLLNVSNKYYQKQQLLAFPPRIYTWNDCVPHFNVIVRDTVFANNFTEPTATLQAGCFSQRPQFRSGEAARKIIRVTIKSLQAPRVTGLPRVT